MSCPHSDGDMYDADCFYCVDCGELVYYDTGEVYVYTPPEYVEIECPGSSCAKYLYGTEHKHMVIEPADRGVVL
jgi:hypothetical protein